MKRVLQILLEPEELDEVHKLAEESATSASAVGRRLIRLGLEALRSGR